ncbi:MAG: chemotaxis protein CheW [Desulfobacteraceae bacterium]|jgi:two-component system chemotaxis sensor kinase CheA
MVFEDDETLRMYVDESLEHLSDIENDLLTIEEGGADIDEDLVNNVFRAAHSIKGGAGFMGLTVVKELSHNLENVLGMVRTRDMVPTPEVISILLKAFDKLHDLIQNIHSSNEADVSVHIESLIAVTTGSLPENEKDNVSSIVEVRHPGSGISFLVPKFDIVQAKKQGKYLYIVEYDMIQDIQKKGKTPFDVISSLLNSGNIIDSKVDIGSVGTLEDELPARIPFRLLFASIIEPDMASTLVDVPKENVNHITEAMITEATGISVQEKLVEKQVAPLAPSPSVPVTPVPQPEPVKVVSQPVVEEKVVAAPVVKKIQEETREVYAVQAEAVEIREEARQGDAASKSVQGSLRVNINLLDTLMTLAGELVLSRNQLMQGVSANNARATELSSQRIDMITSELQEAIMRTRMQPISNVFNKFTRVVRDLSKDLGKQIDLFIEGKDVELDKTIIEAINDPLTHLVRNSVDHGIESPDIRMSLKKPMTGKIVLKAFHEAGQVNIEITDDGNGIDGDKMADLSVKKGLITEQERSMMSEKDRINLIFLPGFSTAQKITDVSGRGVGMDVVKTNLDKLGGIIDIDSVVGSGTTFRIKLPLTLAIIPSQIISIGSERYAIPQVNLDELLRIPAAQVKERIEKVGNAEVVRLRGTLLPLLNLAQILGIQKTYIDPETGESYPDKRLAISDRRSRNMDANMDEILVDPAHMKSRSSEDRSYRSASAINIAVVSAGSFKYGLVVDRLCDSEEIVVKPLGRHLSQCEGYAGATIMGDGKVALILDVASLARMGNLMTVSTKAMEKDALRALAVGTDRTSLLLFRNDEKEQFAAPLNLVERIERIQTSDIEVVGGKRVIQYRGGTLPLHELSEVAQVKPLPERNQHEVIVFKISGKEVGLLVAPPVDAMEVDLNIDATTLKQTGIMGSIIVGDFTTLMIDMFDIVKTLNPDWFIEKESVTRLTKKAPESVTLLFAEDSAFFRNQVKGFFEDEGFKVVAAEDGAKAWALLEELGDAITGVVTDLEMPVMDGFELAKKIKTSSKYGHLPVIALTSLASESDIKKGKAAGIDSYEIKLDREQLVSVVRSYMLK